MFFTHLKECSCPRKSRIKCSMNQKMKSSSSRYRSRPATAIAFLLTMFMANSRAGSPPEPVANSQSKSGSTPELLESDSVPEDDGACDHLPGTRLPSIYLQSTAGRRVNLAEESKGRIIIYCYPRTGKPGEAPVNGWDAIPGARGCTAQTCGFRDEFSKLRARGAAVFGLSTQTTQYQQEMAGRLNLPFEVLSDSELTFTKALRLPTFQVGSEIFIKRLTLVVEDGIIVKVFYPVFPPELNAGHVAAWLRDRSSRTSQFR
jgi:peroxiredoxin